MFVFPFSRQEFEQRFAVFFVKYFNSGKYIFFFSVLFFFLVFGQEYLELIERQEYQKAFAYLNRRLKPMEGTAASTPNEFLSLCYLLTCKSVADAPHFRSWGGVLSGRETLADELARLVRGDGAGGTRRPHFQFCCGAGGII